MSYPKESHEPARIYPRVRGRRWRCPESFGLRILNEIRQLAEPLIVTCQPLRSTRPQRSRPIRQTPVAGLNMKLAIELSDEQERVILAVAAGEMTREEFTRWVEQTVCETSESTIS